MKQLIKMSLFANKDRILICSCCNMFWMLVVMYSAVDVPHYGKSKCTTDFCSLLDNFPVE